MAKFQITTENLLVNQVGGCDDTIWSAVDNTSYPELINTP